jgi:hypothetical protein
MAHKARTSMSLATSATSLKILINLLSTEELLERKEADLD